MINVSTTRIDFGTNKITEKIFKAAKLYAIQM